MKFERQQIRNLQGSVEYKRHITKVYAKRAIEAALARAKKS